MTIRRKILLMMIGVSVIPIILIAFIILSANMKTIEKLHINRLDSITHTSASAYTEIIGYRKDELRLLASSWGIRDFMTDMVQSQNKDVSAQALVGINDYFHTYVETISSFDDLLITDMNGIVITAIHDELVGMDLSNMDYFKSIRDNGNRNYISSSKIHDSLFAPEDPNAKALALSTSLCSASGKRLGVLVAFVDANILAQFSHSISFGETGLSFVIDADNYILYHPEARFFNSCTTAPALANLLERYRKNEIPKSDIIYDSMDGVPRIYYYEVMDEISLILLLRQDYSEFSEDETKAILITVVTSALALLVVILLSIKISGNITKPIQKLNKAFASGNEKGDYFVCDLKSSDEFGDMATNYNRMITKLQEQYILLKDEKDINEYNALHNKLSHLYNRYAFEQELSRLLGRNVSYGIIFLDIDNFKQINDIYGRPMGDTILNEFGKRLLASHGKFDLCAHIGGDEFLLAKAGSAHVIQNALDTLFDELSVPFVINDTNLVLKISAGISSYPDNGTSVEALINNADISLHEVKKSGKGIYTFYSPEMRIGLERYNNIIQTLKNCISEKELFLMYQPIYDSNTTTIVGFEALMRIMSKEFGLISPVEFIPIAEYEKNSMLQIGNWAFDSATDFLRRLIDEKCFDGYFALNVSSLQLSQDDFVDSILECLDRKRIPYNQIQLEITRGTTKDEMDLYAKKLSRLHEAGIRIALDDFSTHHSWYYYLTHMPLDVIKLDTPFFFDIESDNHVATINHSMIDLVHRFDLKITAEGIESQSVFSILKDYGCDSMQGFYLNQPLREPNIMELL